MEIVDIVDAVFMALCGILCLFLLSLYIVVFIMIFRFRDI